MFRKLNTSEIDAVNSGDTIVASFASGEVTALRAANANVEA